MKSASAEALPFGRSGAFVGDGHRFDGVKQDKEYHQNGDDNFNGVEFRAARNVGLRTVIRFEAVTVFETGIFVPVFRGIFVHLHVGRMKGVLRVRISVTESAGTAIAGIARR